MRAIFSINKSLSLLSLILITMSSTAYAEIEECYSTEFGLNYASDMSQYINISDIPPNMNQALQAIKLEKNNVYYRVLDNFNKVLFDKLYDILVYSDGHILAKRGGKFGLIDNNGRLVHDFKYHSIDLLNDGQAILSKYINGQLSDALVSEQGEWLYPKSKQFEPGLRIIGAYYDTDSQKGYFQISKKEQLGLIDDTGEIAIPVIYDEMESLDYCDSSAFVMRVRLGNQVGLINHKNKFVVPIRAKQSISTFSVVGYEPFILSIESASQGVADALYWSPNTADVMSEQLINPKGDVLITSDTPIKSLGSHLYKFSNNGKVGVINDWAEIVLDTYYDDITFEYDSPLIAQRAGKFGILNTDQSGDTLKVRHYFDSIKRIEDKSVIKATFATTYVTSIEAADSVVVEGEMNAEIDSYNYVLPDEVWNTFDQNDIKYSVSSSLEHDYYANRSPQAYIASSNDKYGVIANSGLVIIPFEYD
ncbi:WG repeat-containing protein, partial [Psychrobacter sp. AOP7-B1-24]|uniref:WG repeat-containing protein n=1 Tax=Psychrobacter sp. AOP7-B1-24 TaxID=3457645 RepID=UPI00402BBF3C